MAIDEMYLENLDEFVNDENKLVTYKWLSKTLSIHVNVAKQMLYTFSEQHKDKGLHLTYLVAGIVHNGDEKLHSVQIIPGASLTSHKESLDIITSCHVYSVQKAKLQDSSPLYMADFDVTKEHILQSNKFSAIKCLTAKPRSEGELQALRVKAQPTKAAPTFAKPSTETSSNAAGGKKKADIGSMFANQKKKSPEKKEAPPKITKSEDSKSSKPQASSAAKSKTNEKPGKSKQGGLSTFFANQAARPKKEKPEAKEKELEKKESPVKETEPEKESPVKEKGEEKKQSPVKEKVEEKKKIPEKAKEKAKPRKDVNKSRRKNSKEEHDDGADKKRRRIQNKVWSDSSEDEEEDMEMEEPIPSPPREPSPPPAEAAIEVDESEEEEEEKVTKSHPGSSSKRRKRTKKMVSKTYVNDEGYMVTEKVMESASETDQSEAEEVAKAPPTSAKAPPTKQAQDKKSKVSPKKVTPEKKKQGNIMSFFKKK